MTTGFSDWPTPKVVSLSSDSGESSVFPPLTKTARASFQKRDLAPKDWQTVKEEYLKLFLNLKKLWDKTAAGAKIKDVRKKIFS